MKNLAKLTAGLMLSASIFTTAWADTITMWTMEEQPDRMAAQKDSGCIQSQNWSRS